MKKITLLFLTMVVFCWQTNAQFTESFETEIPVTWTTLDIASSSVWSWSDSPSGTGGAQDGVGVAIIESGYPDANDDYLITPQIIVTAGVSDRLSFYVQSRSGSFLESYEVLLSTTTATSAADFSVVLQAESDAPAAWTKQTFDLSTYVGQSVYVAIRATSLDEWEMYVDNFVNDTFPACMEPTELSATNIFNTSVDLSWTENGTATSWNIEIVDITAGGTVTGTPTVIGVSNPYSLMSLVANNDYEYYVQADCGVEGTSIMSGPYAFTTACDAFTAPYSEDFDNGGVLPNCWSMSSDSGEEDWLFADSGSGHIGNGGTLSGNTASDGYFAWCDASGDHGPRYLVSPFVDLSSLTTPAFSFYEISNSEDSANAQLDLEIWDGAAWNLMGTYNTNTAGWELKEIDISSLTFTGPAQARFTFSELVPGDFDDDIAIDDVSFFEAPTCTDPSTLMVTNITTMSADFTWTENGAATSWNIELVDVTAGGTATGVATTTGVSNPFNQTSLVTANTYQYYVQADCGAADGVSNWVGPFEFNTICETFIAPYTEDFENGGEIPNCWSMSSDTGEEDWMFRNTGTGHIGNDGTLSGNTASDGYFAWCDASGDHGPRYLLSPFVDVSTLTTPALSFYVISDSEDSVNAQLDVEIWDGAAWNLMGTYNTNTAGWELKIISTSGLTFTGPAQARFTFSEVIDPSDFDDDIAIDDVTFDEAPTCIPPSSLSATNITTTTADLGWSSTGTATSWNIELVDVTAGGLATGVATETGVTNPFSQTNLVASNTYEFYVQGDCGVDGTSMWVGPFSFKTEILPAACGGSFVDSGGSSSDYSSSEFTSTTILPDNSGEVVTITFTYVDIEAASTSAGNQSGCYDFLTIYNGPDNTYPILAQTLCGQESGDGTTPSIPSSELNVGDVFTSTDPSGALTIEFSSDSSVELTGWEATVTCAVLNIDDMVNETAFTYYPNPVKNTLTLNALNTIDNVKIYNMLGQRMLDVSPNSLESVLDMSSLLVGTYFVKVTIADITKTIRIIKQ